MGNGWVQAIARAGIVAAAVLLILWLVPAARVYSPRRRLASTGGAAWEKIPE